MDFETNEISKLVGRRQEKVPEERAFPVKTLADVLAEIRRVGGTGKLEIHFKNGQARGDAKWNGVVKP